MSQFSREYRALLQDAIRQGVTEHNARTNEAVFVIPEARFFRLNLGDGRMPVPNLRKIHVRSAAAEVAWFLQGTQDVGFMKKYAPFWDKFTEDDGVTIASAYGYRWRRHFGRDQIVDAIKTLQGNKSDRRVYVSAWDPAADGLGRPGKNVPCPVGFTLSITDNKLNSSMLIRSSDLFVGLPYDVLGHALLVQAIARSVACDLKMGTLSFMLAHPHVYAKHMDMVVGSIQHFGIGYQPICYLPTAWTVQGITESPDAYVEHCTELAKMTHWPEYNPRPEVFV